MAQVTITERFVKSLEPGPKRQDYRDVRLPGFCVRVTTKGSISFSIVYRPKGPVRRQRRMGLGSWPTVSVAEARAQAERVMAQVQLGEDPMEERQKLEQPQLGFRGLWMEYRRRYLERECRPVTQSNVIGIVENWLLPAWEGREAASIEPRDVVKMLDDIEASSPTTAIEARGIIRRIYRWGSGKLLVEHDPTFGTKSPPRPKPRKRFLDAEEIAVLWDEVRSAHPCMAALIRFTLTTGQRRSEVIKMRRAELSRDLWTLPAARTKSERTHVVPLSDLALSLLPAPKPSGSPYVFWSDHGARFHLSSPLNIIRTVVDRANMEPFSVHDLRRTAATHMARLGVDPFVVDRVLNHAHQRIRGTYNHYAYLDEKREALQAWASELKAITGHPVAEAMRSGG